MDMYIANVLKLKHNNIDSEADITELDIEQMYEGQTEDNKQNTQKQLHQSNKIRFQF